MSQTERPELLDLGGVETSNFPEQIERITAMDAEIDYAASGQDIVDEALASRLTGPKDGEVIVVRGDSITERHTNSGDLRNQTDHDYHGKTQ